MKYDLNNFTSTQTDRHGYSTLSKTLHWVMAAVIVIAWIMGYYSSTLPLQQKIATGSVTLHKSIASITLFLLAARILVRLYYGVPELPSTMPLSAKVAARGGHLMLYLCMIGVPLSGWAWSSASGYSVPVAGLFNLPPLLPKTAALAASLRPVHVTLAFSTAALVAGHALMALKHQLIDRDDVLRSMLPRFSRVRSTRRTSQSEN